MKRFGAQKWVLGVFLAMVLTGGLSWAEPSSVIRANCKKAGIASQEIAKDYFYIQQKLKVTSARRSLKQNILSMSESLRKLQATVKDPEKQKVVDFMMMSLGELKSTIKEDFYLENGSLVMDYTDAILEGVKTFVKHPSLDTKNMLAATTFMKFALVRASKFYIAFRAGYNDPLTVEEAKKSVKVFSAFLTKVQNYNYPSNMANGPVKKLSKYWPVSKSFYLGLEKNALPTIVFISTKHMESALNKLIAFHKKELE